MKRIFSLLTVAAILLSLASCSGRGTGKSITYPLSGSPGTLDPQYTDEVGAQIIINNIFAGLVKRDENGEIVPELAESWNISEDGLTYTFTLKYKPKDISESKSENTPENEAEETLTDKVKGVLKKKFKKIFKDKSEDSTEGKSEKKLEWFCHKDIKSEFGAEFYDKFCVEPVTAKDFVFACRRTIDPATGSPHARRLFVIENAAKIAAKKADVSTLGVSAPDDSTVVFRLTEKCDDFLSRLTECEFMPCNEEFFNATKGRYGLSTKYLLCNGPFYIGAWNFETAVTIKANRFYSGGDPAKPTSVTFSFDPSMESVCKKLSNDTFCAALLPPDCPVPEGVKVEKELKNTVFGFMFNCSDEVLSNVSLRKAFCSSIRREFFTSGNTTDTEQHGIVPECCKAGTVSYREKVGGQTPEIKHSDIQSKLYWAAALEELKAEEVSVTILCPESTDMALREQVQIWQKNFGTEFKVTIENADAETIKQRVNSGNYQIALSSLETEYDNAVSFFSNLNSSGMFGLKSDDFDAIIKRLVTVETDEDMLSGCFTAEDWLLKNGVCFPLYSRSARFVISNDTDGITMTDSERTVSFINARRFD